MCYPGSLSVARPEVPGKLWGGPPLDKVAALAKSALAECEMTSLGCHRQAHVATGAEMTSSLGYHRQTHTAIGAEMTSLGYHIQAYTATGDEGWDTSLYYMCLFRQILS